MRASVRIIVIYCCAMAYTNCQMINAPGNRRIFSDGEDCVKYCEIPCELTPVYDGKYPQSYEYVCHQFNPLGASKSGWLEVALIVMGVLGCCIGIAVVYAWQKSRLNVTPSAGTFENIACEKV
ncbi:hypothetical protein AAVH_25277 [Aphelenchoides avenae]|nr:hypothetical protein AAVH_25277 [Aphelenchus avenae]